jgi:hypothetical protein
MRKLSMLLMTVAILFLVSGNLRADDKPACSKDKATANKAEGCTKGMHDSANTVRTGEKSGCSKACTKSAADKSCCDKNAAECLMTCAWKPDSCQSLDKLIPTMTYQVGDKETSCPMEAAKLAGKDGKITYVVMGKTYANEAEANKAMTELMNTLSQELLTVRTVVGDESFECPHMAQQKAEETHSKVQYVALRKRFDTKERAMAAVDQAKKAMNQVDVTYTVDGKNMKCSKTAQKCAQEGKKVECHVGDKTTCCPTQADMLVAQARLMALVKTIQAPEVEKAASL